MFPHPQRAFGRKSRRRLALVVLTTVLVLLGASAGLGVRERYAQRLVITPTSVASAADPIPEKTDVEAIARAKRDLPMLEEMWGYGGGQTANIWYVNAPSDIRAGEPLLVTVKGLQVDGHPFDDALVEITWRLGEATYRDVTFTDRYGNAEVNRQLDPGCRGKECVVAVRMYKDDMQGLAYSTFTAR